MEEGIDVFLADLKRLAHLANIKFVDNNEEIVKLAFVMGLPSRVAAQLRATPKIETLDLNAVLQISRVVMSEASKGESFEVGAVARTCESKPSSGCFICGGPHYRRNCLKVKDITFYACNKPGHVAQNCKSAGNGKYLCTNNDPGRIDGAIIPRMNILVNGQPACTLIDSGCTQTLVGPTVQNSKVYGLKRIMTADGRMINCEGEIPVVFSVAGKTIEVLCVVTKTMVHEVNVIVGTDVLRCFNSS